MYEIYSKIDCSNCDKAKQALVQEGYEHKVRILGVHFTIEDLYQIAPRSIRSFPVIFKSGEFVGGLKELLIDIEKQGGYHGR